MSQEASPESAAGIHAPRVNDANVLAQYANFCRVTGTPEELIIDFGLNAQARPNDDQPVNITGRTVMNYFTAKRLLQALGMSVARHEQAFGVLETSIQKRLATK